MVLEILTEVNEDVKKIIDRKLKGRQVFFSYTCNSFKKNISPIGISRYKRHFLA